jgi:lambda repressor-like predicted transcriptional regulator
MARSERARPAALTDAWPGTPSASPIGEVARLFVVNLRRAIGERSIRAAAEECGLHHATLLGILEGRTWPDLETIAKLERGLTADLWPGRTRH